MNGCCPFNSGSPVKRRQSESGAGSQARERGTALVVVLGLVALIGAWGVNAAYEDMIDIRRAENIKDAIYASQASRSFCVGEAEAAP